MKNRAILLLLVGLMISSSFAFGQALKDTLQKDSIHAPVIPKAPAPPQFKNYFSAEQSWQISKEAYEKQLKAMGLSEKEIDQKVQEFEKQKPALMERIKVEMKMVGKQLQLSEYQRKMAEKQIQEVTKELKSAEFQKKMAEVQRKLSGKLQKMAGEWRNSVKNLVHENILLSGKDSKNRTVKFKVIQKNTLFLNINCRISSGSVLVEVFDPKGQKEGELSLEHGKDSTTKTKARFAGNTSGSLNKIINAPEAGDWEVKVKPKKSEGHVFLSIGQFNKPAI